MRFKFKIPLLLAVLAVGVMGVSAASASAHEFLLTSKLMENINVEAKTDNGQGFEISGAVAVCMKGTFKTVPTGGVLAPAETLLVHPTYSSCSVELGGEFTATVTTTGCNYVFHAAAPGKAEGSVDIECETGDRIKVVVSGLNCEISVGPQTGLKTIEYVNLAGGKVEVRAKVSNIAYETTCKGIEAKGNTGKYQEGTLPPPALGSGPAIALAEAKNPSTGTFEEAMVE